MANTERSCYLNHIRRLQVENAVLRGVVAQERLRRQAAWGWYVRKLESRMMWLFDAMMLSNSRTRRLTRRTLID